MKSSADNRVIVTSEGETLAKPDNIPDELWCKPECTDWREKAFELARELEDAQKQNGLLRNENRALFDTMNSLAERNTALGERIRELEWTAESITDRRIARWMHKVILRLRVMLRNLYRRVVK